MQGLKRTGLEAFRGKMSMIGTITISIKLTLCRSNSGIGQLVPQFCSTPSRTMRTLEFNSIHKSQGKGSLIDSHMLLAWSISMTLCTTSRWEWYRLKKIKVNPRTILLRVLVSFFIKLRVNGLTLKCQKLRKTLKNLRSARLSRKILLKLRWIR